MSHATSEPDERIASVTAEGQLRGNMGTLELAFTALAFNAPLAVVAGFIPVIAGFENGLGSPLVFPAMGALLLVFSVGLNAMAVRMERPGAFYVYIARGLGRPPGLAAAFIAILTYVAVAAGTLSLLGVVAGNFATQVLGAAESGPWWVWALLGWAIITALSLLNVEVSAKILGIAMLFEAAIVVLWNTRIFIDGGPAGRDVPVFSHVFDGSIALGLLFVALCMTGFESLQVFREETRDPVRTVPRATYIFLIVLAVTYGISTYAYIVAQGSGQGLADGAADPTGTVLASIKQYAGGVAGDAASLFLITSAFACTLAIQNIAARYLYALGRDRVVPIRLGQVSARHGSPVVASVASASMILIVVLIPLLNGADPIKAYTVLSGLGVYGIVLLWVATGASVLVFFRRNKQEAVSLWSSVTAPVLSLVGLAAVFWLATTHLGDLVGDVKLAQLILIFAGVIAAGGAGLALWWRKADPAVYDSIGRQQP